VLWTWRNEVGIRVSPFRHAVFAFEIKSHAIKSYTKNFDENDVHGDITAVNERLILMFDMLLAGFPCQAFFVAGRKMGRKNGIPARKSDKTRRYPGKEQLTKKSDDVHVSLTRCF